MTDAELRQLALDAVDGKVFGSWQLRAPDDLTTSFPVLLLMDDEQIDKIQRQFVHVYEYLDKANPLAINGRPIFLSCRGLTADEWSTMSMYARELQAQRENFLKGTPP